MIVRVVLVDQVNLKKIKEFFGAYFKQYFIDKKNGRLKSTFPR